MFVPIMTTYILKWLLLAIFTFRRHLRQL